jgi:hypothetical protein
MMADLDSRLRESLEHLGVKPTHAENSPG